MGRDTDSIDEETNGKKETELKIVTEYELLNMKLDTIIKILLEKK